MSHQHPSGIIVDVVGIEEPSQGRSCEVYDTCGDIMAVDTIVRFRAVQLLGDQKNKRLPMQRIGSLTELIDAELVFYHGIA